MEGVREVWQGAATFPPGDPCMALARSVSNRCFRRKAVKPPKKQPGLIISPVRQYHKTFSLSM